MPLRLKIIMLCILFAGLSYLLGSINFAILTTKKVTGKDIRSFGSGNAGMTNVMRTAGFMPGVITLLGDFGKAALAVVLGKYLLTDLLLMLVPTSVYPPGFTYDYAAALAPIYGGTICGLFCVIGHCYPIYFGFKGGKGVATCIGMITVLDWRIALILVGVFAIVFLISRIISLSSITAAVCYPIATYILYSERNDFLPVANYIKIANQSGYRPFFMSLVWFETIAATVFALILIINHKENIVRLIRGEEKKLSLKKPKKSVKTENDG